MTIDTMPRVGEGIDLLAAWLLAYVRERRRLVYTSELAPEAVRRGWPRYAVHTQLSQWCRAGALDLISPGCYLATL